MRPPVASPAQPTPARTGLLRTLHDRFAHLVHEVGKFGIVGAVCYAIDVGIFWVLNHLTGEKYLAYAVSTVVAATFAFVGNRFWTWRHRERSGLRREYALYFGFNGVGLLIGLACLYISSNWLGALWPSVFHTGLADLVSGKVVGTLIASLFRFWAYRRFVFRTGEAPAVNA